MIIYYFKLFHSKSFMGININIQLSRQVNLISQIFARSNNFSLLNSYVSLYNVYSHTFTHTQIDMTLSLFFYFFLSVIFFVFIEINNIYE
jgi:hypothetical protein